jgi:hypothetical protein
MEFLAIGKLRFEFRQFYSLPPEYGLPYRKCGEVAP